MQAMHRWWSIGLACCLLAGCASRVTQENFDKIKTGMTREQVIAILGEPTTSYQGIASWQERSSTKMITITFAEGKVMERTATGFQ